MSRDSTPILPATKFKPFGGTGYTLSAGEVYSDPAPAGASEAGATSSATPGYSSLRQDGGGSTNESSSSAAAAEREKRARAAERRLKDTSNADSKPLLNAV